MEAAELVLASVLYLGAAVYTLYNGSPELLDGVISYLMNANIIKVI